MKIKIWFVFSVIFCLLFLALNNASGASVTEENAIPASGMPGRSIPARPIPHHEPGQTSQAAHIRREENRVNAAGLEETVEMVGLEALLSDGTITDPFEGNYTFVNLDQILLARNDGTNIRMETWSAFEPPDETTTPAVITNSQETLGTGMADTTPSIAAGDLNGDGQSEQIVGWIDDDGNVQLSIGELPGKLGRLTSDPAATAHINGTMDLMVRGYDDALWHRHYNGQEWEEWNNDAGGYLLSGPALASHGDGQIDVFAAGVYSSTGVVITETATSIYWRHWNGGAWSADWNLVDVDPADEVILLDDPAAVARGTGIDLFRRASDNTLRWMHYDGADWGGWQNLGGIITSAPAAVTLGPNHLQVFAKFYDGRLWYRAYNGGSWGQWQPLGDLILTSAPTTASPAANQIDIYGRGEDDALWMNRFNGTAWSGWQSLGGFLGSGVGVAVRNGSIDLFAQTMNDPATEDDEPDGSLQQNNFNASSWTGWVEQGGLKTCCWTYDTGMQGYRVSVETGYFIRGDREQIVLTFIEEDKVFIHLFDVNNGLRPEQLTSQYWMLGSTVWNHIDVTTGDFPGTDEFRDEIVFATLGNNYDNNNSYRCTVVFRVWHATDWNLYYFGRSCTSSYLFEDSQSAITSGDFDDNGENEVASVWYWCSIPNDCTFFLEIYGVDVDFLSRKDYIAWKSDYKSPCPTVDLAAANLDLSENGTYEIVYTGPAPPPYPSSINNGEFAIFNYDKSTEEIVKQYDLPFVTEEYPSKVTVGDFNRDLWPDIARLYYVHEGLQVLEIYGYDDESEEYKKSEETLITYIEPIAMAAGDLTGESLRVGPPTYRQQRKVGSIAAIINAPPTHTDTLNGQEYVIPTEASREDTYAAYSVTSSQTTNTTIQVQRNWGLAANGSFTQGDPEGTHITVSAGVTYGEHFENTEEQFNSIIIKDTVKTAGDDALIYTANTYRLWEYPVYRDDDHTPESYISVVFPTGSVSPISEPGNLCEEGWYLPTHQVDNLWSYPSIPPVDQEPPFIGYIPDGYMYDKPFTTGGIESGFEYALSQYTGSLLTKETAFGVSTGFETQIGGNKVEISCEPSGVGVAYTVVTPALKASVEGEYHSSDLSTTEVTISEEVTLENLYGPVDNTDYFSVKSFLFRPAGGYLVLDHTTKSTTADFWELYDKPDPTFIRPWADGHCTQAKADYTNDIIIRPFFVNPGETVVITATVRNFSDQSANNVKVRFYLGDPDEGGRQIGPDRVIPTLSRSIGPETVSIEWTVEGRGVERIYAVIDPDNELAEMHDEVTNINNNKGYNLIQTGEAGFLDPGLRTEDTYHIFSYHGQGQSFGPAFNAYVPLANVSEVLFFKFVVLENIPSPPPNMAAIGDVVALETYLEGQEQAGFVLKPTSDAEPGVITVQYSDANLRGTPEEDLSFYTWTGTQWIEPSCAGHTQLHLPDENLFVVPICETGTFALFGEAYGDYDVLLPLVITNR